MLRVIDNPKPALVGDSLADFLSYLNAPSAIYIDGHDHTRTRAVCTLLHGNEPSGLQAIYHYLRSGHVPQTRVVFIIASVEAAMYSPMFSQRMLPGKRDLNRCFRPPYLDEQGQLAKSILDLLHSAQPECLIDIHNTSGSGPAFAVAISADEDHKALTSLFTNDLIVTDLRLGALMELSEQELVSVTVECGGAGDYSSQIVAQEGLHRFLDTERVLAEKGLSYQVNCFYNPIRLETRNAGKVAYGDTPAKDAVITLPSQAEKFNYGTLTRDETIGFLGPSGLDALSAKDHKGNEQLHEYFEVRDACLCPKKPLKLFMVTNNPVIAQADCLFYFIAP